MKLISLHFATAARTSAILLLLVYLASCATTGPVQTEIPVSIKKPFINSIELEKQVHALVNKERRDKGVPPLAWNDRLSTIARKHSRDMAKRNYFDHNSPEGRDFSYRYRNEGYSCAIKVKQTIYMGAENILQNNLYDRVVFVNGKTHYDWNTMKKIAESTVQGWMNSTGHRKNILTPHWISEGIGVWISEDDKVYITQNFC